LLDGHSDKCCQLHVQSCMMSWSHMTASMYKLSWFRSAVALYSRIRQLV